MHRADRMFMEQLCYKQRHRWANGMVVDHIIAAENCVKRCKEGIDRCIQCRFFQRKDPAYMHAIHIINVVPFLKSAIIYCNIIAALHKTCGKRPHNDLHTART